MRFKNTLYTLTRSRFTDHPVREKTTSVRHHGPPTRVRYGITMEKYTTRIAVCWSVENSSLPNLSAHSDVFFTKTLFYCFYFFPRFSLITVTNCKYALRTHLSSERVNILCFCIDHRCEMKSSPVSVPTTNVIFAGSLRNRFRKIFDEST